MLYLKMYEDYEYNEPLFEELPYDEYGRIPASSYIRFKDYYRKDLVNYIKSKLPSIFAHNEFLIDISEHDNSPFDSFDIIERKHLPFTISLRITDEDWFIVKLIYYCHQGTYLHWKCDGLKGFLAFLKYLSSQPKKYEDWKGRNLLRNPFSSIKISSQFTYTDEQLKKLVDKLDIDKVFSVKLDRKKPEPGHSYPTWKLNIGDMLYFDIYYVASINCFGIRLIKRDLSGDSTNANYTCFAEAGLYSLLEKEYENLANMYHV